MKKNILAAFMVPHPPMIIPQVGRGSEKQIEKTIRAYEQVADEIASLKPETIIISSPHSIMYADYFHISPGHGAKGSFADFRAKDVAFSETYDQGLVEWIEALAEEKGLPAGTMGERDSRLDHGTMVPLYFIRKKYTDFKLVRLGLSGLPLTDHYRLGQIIGEACERSGRKVVYIASGDLSHKLQDYGPYGFTPEGPEYDRKIMDVCSRGAFGELLDFDEAFCDKAAECGHRSFVIMAGCLDGLDVRSTVLSHEDVTGVGYGICSFYPEKENKDRHFLSLYLKEQETRLEKEREEADPYVKLARETVESYIRDNRIPEIPVGLPREMYSDKAGTFVSIHEHGRLRGCIGTILPTRKNIAEEIIANAISASTRDPRFDPIGPQELKWLEISVDVLGQPEEIPSPDYLDVKKYGVIVSRGGKRGLLLPDLEGVDTVEDQIAIAKRKAGISARAEVKLERFEVIRHH